MIITSCHVFFLSFFNFFLVNNTQDLTFPIRVTEQMFLAAFSIAILRVLLMLGVEPDTEHLAKVRVDGLR